MSEAPKTPDIRKGEVITCRNGHEICEALDDVFPYQLNWHLCFGKWRQSEPETGSRLPTCEVCGSEVFDFPIVWVNGKERKSNA